MKKMIVLVMAFCLAMVGFSEKVMAAPAPISAQEGSQLNELAGHDGLLALKAGDSFPDAPRALDAREEFALRNLSGNSRNLENLKGGEYIEIGLVTAVLIVVLVVLLVR